MQTFATGLGRARMRRQSGSVATLGALWLMIAVICLATIDIGNVFWQKRELQKIADLAALAGASGTLDPNSCRTNAERNLTLNGSMVSELVTAQAGRWDKSASPFFGSAAKASEINACRVSFQRTVPFLFVFAAGAERGRQISAQATAMQSARIARLSVRSTLLALDTEKSALLDAVVGGLLGGKISLGVAGWQGIANSNISLLSFLDALAVRAGLNVGDYDQVVKTKVTLDKVMLAMLDALPQQGSLAAVNALNALALGVGNIQIALQDILKLGTGLGSDALRTDVNVLDLVTTVAQLANSQNAAKVGVNLNLGLVEVGLNLKVIEPPQSAIGDPVRDRIEAKTSQIDLVTGLKLNLALVAASLSLDVKLAQGSALLVDHMCSPQKSMSVNGVTGVGTVALKGAVDILPLPLIPKLTIPVEVKIPLVSKTQRLEYQNPPNLNEPAKWATIYQSNLVESLIQSLTDQLGLLGSLLAVVLAPLTLVLDAVLNLVLNLLGLNLAQTDIGAQLNCIGRNVVLVE
ncbi:pilus assembly protein TadG-related protein [Comamonas testosteroni]|uniref:pilus assembly protein TadG-related protein n=1 Tax=Comamonas testosteroni TaxID=285 RepID=UPI002DBB8F78|nr:pilus assembly protein TadG-related protein [Comamonas testosteroni]MEB5963189.1 pilus assembly protein TadG-related protein [Comamonas testosteroni]